MNAADPAQWIGSAPISSNDSVVPMDESVNVSPSGAENFTQCGVKWFLEKSGGTNGDSTAQILGSAIHEFARLRVEDPALTSADLIAKLESSWALIDQSQGWVSTTSLKRAIKMLERFSEYHEKTTRTVAGVELNFTIDVGRARVRGSVDRLEVESDGSFFVIDFKTGAQAISHEDAATNLQLACYQLAVSLDGFEKKLSGTVSRGAELVYLGSKNKSLTTRTQHVINEVEIRNTIEEIAQGMGAAQFRATVNSQCKKCVVKSSCPIQVEGRTVIE